MRMGVSHLKATGTGLVETANMAAVEPPDITYKPSLPKEVIDSGKISDAQLESIIYAGQAGSAVLPNGRRGGYMNGDGTGVGKGTIAAGIALDNWNKGRKKILWLSLKSGLVKQAQRDLDWVGAPFKAKMANDWGFGEKINHEGVVFSSYKMLTQESKDINIAANRLQQITDWNPDVVILDESHAAKNAIGSEIYDEEGEGKKGSKNILATEGTDSGKAVLALDKALPDTRMNYFSATAFTHVRNLGYAGRLGLWGKGTQFPDFRNFLVEIEKGGLGAMELVAREMKAQGRYTARQISFKGVDYRQAEAKLTPAQRNMYDSAVDAWQRVLANIDTAIEAIVGEGNARSKGLAKSRALSQFWSNNLAFYRQLLTTMKIPTVIGEIEKALSENKSVFIDLVSTGEAESTRQMAKALQSDTDFADMDLSAKQMINNYLDKSFPIYLMEDYEDENGNKQPRFVLDEKGNKVVSQKAVELRDEVKKSLDTIKLPKSPMDEIIDHFGADAVAEVSGRKARIAEDPNTGKPIELKRVKPKGTTAKDVNEWERQNFMTGKKRIAIASGAGGTGFDFHADKRQPNQQRRVHITIEPSWSADAQMQKFGRTHRTNQAVPPEYVLVATDMGGEKRFLSAIASRLSSLGALTRGERKAGGMSEVLSKYDIESEYGQAAVNAFLDQLTFAANRTTVGDVAVPLKPFPVELGEDQAKREELQKLLGFKEKQDSAPVGQFLNRLLNLPSALQGAAFDHLMNTFEDIVNRVKEAGAFDEGTLQLKALSTKIKKDEVIRENEGSTPTRHVIVDGEFPVKYTSWPDAKAHLEARRDQPGVVFRNKRSGQLWAVRRSFEDKFDQATGLMVPMVTAIGVRGQRRTFPSAELTGDNYERVQSPKETWESEIEGLPKTEHEDVHLITGSVLGVWKTLSENAQGYKVPVVSVRGEGDEPITGIRLPNNTAKDIVDMLSGKADYSPATIFQRVWNQQQSVELVGARLQRTRMMGEPALTIMAGSTQGQNKLAGLGLKSMDTAAGSRFYIPISADPAEGEQARVVEKLGEVLKLFPPKTPAQGEKGAAPMLMDLAQWARDKFADEGPKVNYSGLGALQTRAVRNLSQIEKASPNVHTAALRAASSRGQAATILRSAVPLIKDALKGGDVTWPEMRLALIESRLQGTRDRWLNFSEQVQSMDSGQFAESYDDQFSGLLGAVEGKRGLPQDLTQTAASLVEKKDWESLREFLAQTFSDAAKHVTQTMEPEWFDEVVNDPGFKKALGIYKELVEKPMAENHSINEGVFSDALGPLDTYYPLISIDRQQNFGPGRRLAYHKPRNTANAFATGLSEGYDATMAAFRDRLAGAVRANDKAALIRVMEKTGWLRSAGRGPAEDAFLAPDGVEYQAERVETASPKMMIKDNKFVHIPAQMSVMPSFMARELKPILERDRPLTTTGVDKLIRLMNSAAISGPSDAIFHAANLVGTLVANTPFLGDTVAWKAASLPLVKRFGALFKIAMTDPKTESAARDIIEMAKLGLVPDRFASQEYSKNAAEDIGAEVTKFGFGPLLFGPTGIDIRARLIMYRLAKEINPQATTQELYHFVNQLGNYVPALQGEIERALKSTGLSPFYTAGSTMLRNGINAWTGMGPMLGEGHGLTTNIRFRRLQDGTWEVAPGLSMRMWNRLTGGAFATLAVWALLYKTMTGKYPWEDKKAKLLQIPASPEFRHSKVGEALWGKDSSTGYINLSFFNPLVSRGARAMGLPGAFEARQLHGTGGQMTEFAARDMLNAIAQPALGPVPKAAFAGVFGKEPYLTDFRDRRGQLSPSFFPAIPPRSKPPAIGARIGAAAGQLNSFYAKVGQATGLLPEGREDKHHDREGIHMPSGGDMLKMITDMVFPSLIGTPSNPSKKADVLREQKTGTR